MELRNSREFLQNEWKESNPGVAGQELSGVRIVFDFFAHPESERHHEGAFQLEQIRRNRSGQKLLVKLKKGQW
jgi:hypothetical protein